MGLKPTKATTNGHARRKLPSWIDQFVEFTDNLESPTIFRKWIAISTIAAALEQKVWVQTSSPIWPNMYTILVGHPGVGKTRTIMEGRKFLSEIPEFQIAPTSTTFASLVDRLMAAKRTVMNMPNPPMEFHSMTLCTDEWGAFMHEYDKQMVAGLTTFYDVNVPYEQWRRGNDLRITIKAPQLSIMAGSTPSNLIQFMPEGAWGQGFTSRLMLIYSDEKPINDKFFGAKSRTLPEDMVHDMRCISTTIGEFQTEDEFENAVDNWRKLGCTPVPSHPKLVHYNTRRPVHLIKLAMVSNVDRDGKLILTAQDFNRAMGWLLEAEQSMPELFRSGTNSEDGRAMEEIYDFVKVGGGAKGLREGQVVKFAAKRVRNAGDVMRLLDTMVRSDMLRVIEQDSKTNLRHFLAGEKPN